MTSGVHKTEQTAFRIPESRLAWLRAQAGREQRTMTAIVNDALAAYESAAYAAASTAALFASRDASLAVTRE